MKYLGALRGSGMLEWGGKPIGRADYEFDGYLVRRGEVVGSGEVRMDPELLADAFGRRDLTIRTDDGRILALRFSGKNLPPGGKLAHAEVREGLPQENEWPR